VPARRMDWPATGRLNDHRTWRAEWTAERPCLYWYLIFDPTSWPQPVHRASAALGTYPWLDPIPVRWLHLTLTDVAFADEVDGGTVDSVVAEVAGALASHPPLRLRLQGLVAMSSAVAMVADPLQPLRRLHEAVGEATCRTVGQACRGMHRAALWPHVSLAYANTDVGADAVTDAIRPHRELASEVPVDAVSLVSATRRDRHYQWHVEATIPLARQPVLAGTAGTASGG
jgi:2'-5' RNA ligase